MIKLKLGKPEHGWVEMTFTDGQFELEDAISDVPCDFIANLVVALNRILTYERIQRVDLSLEPGCYVLTLSRDGERFTLRWELTGSYGHDGLLHEASGGFKEIILPLYRAVREFYSHQYTDPHWPEVDEKEMSELTGLVKDFKDLS